MVPKYGVGSLVDTGSLWWGFAEQLYIILKGIVGISC